MATTIPIALLFILLYIKQAKRRKSFIENPNVVLLQIGTLSQSQLDSDRTIYSDFYSNVTEKTTNTLQELIDFINNSSFDLFHLFVDIDKDGKIYDASQNSIEIENFIDIIQKRNAKYIFFAKDNPPGCYSNGAKGLKFTANTVMTLERKGNSFPDFLKKIFSNVSKGQPFPVAWNKFAPQIPKVKNDDMPEVFAVMGAGNVILLSNK
jgi:hypothetical protein